MPRKMKDSGVEWIGEIPEEWELIRGKFLFRERNEKGNAVELQLLSPTQKYGVIPQTLYDEISGMKAVKLEKDADLSTFKSIYRGDFCISLRSFQGGFEYSNYNGVVSPAYHVFYKTANICNDYYRFLFKEKSFIDKMASLTRTFRDGKSIAFSDFANSLIPVPPIAEQKRISVFLGNECKEIDNIIAQTRASIEEYKKLKQAVITQAVTKGIRGDRPMKPSGSTWFTEIPDSWEMKRIKYIFRIKKDIAGKEGYTVLSITQKGVIPKNIASNEGQLAENYSNYQFLHPGQFAMNHMDLLTGWVDISSYDGVTSPDYRVFEFIRTDDDSPEYYLFLLQMCYKNRIFYGLGQGVSGMGRWRLQADKFLNFEIPVPSYEEQCEIAEYLSMKCGAIDELIASKQHLLAELENYKKSLIYEYVTGKKEVPIG